MMKNSQPTILTIAGSDCSAGAGIQADLKAITANGGYALTALTSVVSETPGVVSQIRLLDAAFITDQVRVLMAGFPIRAAKTGMLGGAEQVQAVAAIWRDVALPRGIPLVVDPVMVATSGGKLLEDDAVRTLSECLLPLAALITPNMDEAEVLWGRAVTTRAEMAACAADLAAKYQTAVLVKGGHLHSDAAADVLVCADGLSWHETARTPGVHTHGTGCTYSAAIAAGLGCGLALVDAVAAAKKYVSRAIAAHFAWSSELHALNHFPDGK
ncbi:MAG: bifunctional hydroxymethylpyrimidine kinase/phosphomethylpyrimidine kinase [Verrucomicrobiaceae bacterium]|nr:bifunctional hydroxymethylpyrimidine kinase/phosphomethylpyrimidine kinase [Verrucomicrobiaceae bacterium]